MKRILMPLIAITIFSMLISCEKYREEVLPVVGVYDANIVGVGGPFSVSISVDYGDHLSIDAPWDGFSWSLANARLQREYEERKRVVIPRQHLGNDLQIWGEGVFYEYTIQIEYTLSVSGDRQKYTLVGTKL